jgi:hypothetical protein
VRGAFPTIDAVVRDIYTVPAENGMPPSSKLGNGFGASQGRYYLTMYAPAFDAYSYVGIVRSEVADADSGATVALIERKLRQLRQMHHFACLSKRGGYY